METKKPNNLYENIYAGDFAKLVANNNLAPAISSIASKQNVLDTHGTTVIALKYKGGVVNLGDRRATAGNAVMFDKAEKVLSLDDNTLIAISGSYGSAVGVVRYLRQALRYYMRSQLQTMSLDGKLQEITRSISGNLPMAMQGIGGFIPLLSAFEQETNTCKIFYFDGMGARFEANDFSAIGSGSERIRGVFDYIIKSKGPFAERKFDDVLIDGLILLDIASDLDSFTGGFSKILPSVKTVSAEGVKTLPDKAIQSAIQKVRKADNADTV